MERVSIHAPTKGATGNSDHLPSGNGVSIHAPTKGATSPALRRRWVSEVSIHAPTKGATQYDLRKSFEVTNHQFNWWFDFAPPKGRCFCSPQRAVPQALLLVRL